MNKDLIEFSYKETY